MKHIVLNIDGMTCGHCVAAVRKELSGVPSVVVRDVRIGSAELDFDETRVPRERLEAAVAAAGYKVLGQPAPETR